MNEEVKNENKHTIKTLIVCGLIQYLPYIPFVFVGILIIIFRNQIAERLVG